MYDRTTLAIENKLKKPTRKFSEVNWDHTSKKLTHVAECMSALCLIYNYLLPNLFVSTNKNNFIYIIILI